MGASQLFARCVCWIAGWPEVQQELPPVRVDDDGSAQWVGAGKVRQPMDDSNDMEEEKEQKKEEEKTNCGLNQPHI